MRQNTQRYWEIDFFRGIAIIMMITYHIMFDLSFLQIISFPLHSTPFLIFLYPIGTLFLLLVGISLVLSYQRYYFKKRKHTRFIKYFKRGLFLFTVALFITIVTWIYPHDGFIVFGVIHCIAISIILSYWFIPRPNIALSIGFIVIFLGFFIKTISTTNPYLFWLGITTPSFYTLDYFPLIPWLGVVFIGIFFGHHIYPYLEKKYTTNQTQPKITQPLTILGKHSLIVYLVHQPILFAILYLLFE